MDVGDLIPGFTPEDERERAIVSDEALLAGLAWGRPRPGHPEGSVGAHVTDLLRRLDGRADRAERVDTAACADTATRADTDARVEGFERLFSADERAMLRLIALTHDSFKYLVDRRRENSGENHHAMRARRFAERYIAAERVLAVIELHDRPYLLWRRFSRAADSGHEELAESAHEGFRAMLGRIPDVDLFARFIELDGSTDGKDPRPTLWFQGELQRSLAR